MRRIGLCSAIFVALVASLVVRAQSSADKLLVGFLGKNWSVLVDSPGFEIKNSGTQQNGREYLLATNDKNGMNVSVTLERVAERADPATCPQYLHKRVESLNSIGLKDVKYYTAAGMAIVEYLVPEVQGHKLQQKHLVACTAKEDIYIDVHLSKVQFKPEDEQLFTELVNRVGFMDSAAVVQSKSTDVKDLMAKGSRHFLQRRYKNAIESYQQALDMEKKQQTLDKNKWRVLVDNLGMAYGITGDLGRAQATLEYGLSQDPAYPMFSYNLACVYAERGDLDNAVEYLRRSFRNKDNLIPGETIPDPQSDDSFQRFRNDPKFRALMTSIR